MSTTTVATANIRHGLPARRARASLDLVLAERPHLVGLQEWHLNRVLLLRRSGSVRITLGPAALLPRGRDYRWTAALVGGCVVGARTDRYEQVDAGWRLLSPPGRADHPGRPVGLEPPRAAVLGVYLDRRTGHEVALVSYHLAPGVQAGGSYRADRPRLVARHRHEHRALQRLVDEQRALGRVVYTVGDSNFDGFELSGLTSCWAGRADSPGTLGPRRKVDDVFGPGPAIDVRVLTTDSDHRAVLAVRSDFDPADLLG